MRTRSRKLCVVLLAGTVLGCGLGVYDDFAPLRLTDNFRVIESGRAYRSAQLDVDTLGMVVDALGIKTVINLRGANPDEAWYQREKALLDNWQLDLVDVRWSATELPSREELLKLYDAFFTVDEPILIHCQAGADRTGAASAIWRMMMLGDSREDAASELCVCYGHFEPLTGAMDELVRIFQPDRAWIEQQYPGP